MTGVELIAAERERQVSQEGWTPEHDDQHDKGELASAAMTYLAGEINDRTRLWWPWEMKWFKPRTYLGNLVKAGALIAAEIDRIQRKSL